MKRVRSGVSLLVVALLLSLVSVVALAADVRMTVLNSKGEVQAQLEDMAAYYSSITPGVTVEVIAAPVGQSPFERAMALYASGNAPALIMLDPGDVLLFRDRAAALNNEKWVADAIDRALDLVTAEDGRVLGFPVTVEGYGFIYNKPVVEAALGGTFDPETINTRDALRKLFEATKASGKGALVISPEDWSLGAHFFSLAYSAQSPSFAEIKEFQEAMKKGEVKLAANAKVNGLLDTFDLMKEFNYDKADPLASTYDRGSQLIGEGEVGIWFQGNWAWPQIKEFDSAGGEFGFLPVPISNNPDDLGNTQIPVGVTKYFILDGEQNSPAQQQAAKDFLNWLVYDPEGQKRLVVDASIIPAFKNITITPEDPLAASIMEYVQKGKIMTFVLNLPADHWAEVGASMQKYLAGYASRDALLAEVEAYWRGL